MSTHVLCSRNHLYLIHVFDLSSIQSKQIGIPSREKNGLKYSTSTISLAQFSPDSSELKISVRFNVEHSHFWLLNSLLTISWKELLGRTRKLKKVGILSNVISTYILGSALSLPRSGICSGLQVCRPNINLILPVRPNYMHKIIQSISFSLCFIRRFAIDVRANHCT